MKVGWRKARRDQRGRYSEGNDISSPCYMCTHVAVSTNTNPRLSYLVEVISQNNGEVTVVEIINESTEQKLKHSISH